MELKLAAKNAVEQRVVDYLIANASEALAAKINAGTKTAAGALAYCKQEARKLDQQDGCVCVDDDTMYGWVVHYFEEDDVKEAVKRPAVTLPGKGSSKVLKCESSKVVKDGGSSKVLKCESSKVFKSEDLAGKKTPMVSLAEALFGGGK